MRLRLLLVLVALLLPGTAAGANIATPRMEAIASWAAGKPITVHCEDDWTVWRPMLDSHGLAPYIGGYANVGDDTVYLSPAVCERLAGGANYWHFGWSLHTLLHESLHAQGIADEAQTECLSLKLVRSAALKFYKLNPKKTLIRTIVRDATEASKRRGAAFQGTC